MHRKNRNRPISFTQRTATHHFINNWKRGMILDKEPFNKIYETFLMGKYKYFPPKHDKWWLRDTTYSKIDKANISFCDGILSKVSRTFSHVIRLLPPKLSLVVTVFYLRCRALDTVEDDPSAFGGDLKKKKKYLTNFYTHYTPLQTIGEKYYRQLLINYNIVGDVNNLLSKKSQETIDGIVKEMGKGMSKYSHYRIENMEEYNEYCYHVAGLVGKGIGRLFDIHEYAPSDFLRKITDPKLVEATHGRGGIEMSMGLFLQKTNIIRDYKEDLDEGIRWYPRDIWKKYKPSFTDLNGDIPSRNCVNELVTDALECVPDIFCYTTLLLHKTDIFNFTAIPVNVAIATLSKLYDNPNLFNSTIKISKGCAVNIMHNSNSMNDVYYWFKKFTLQIKSKIRADDPNAMKTQSACNRILACIEKNYKPPFITNGEKIFFIVVLILLYIAFSRMLNKYKCT